MKKKWIIGLSIVLPLVVVLMAITFYLYIFEGFKVKAQAQADQKISQDMLKELEREQEFLEKERKRLLQYQQNLDTFKAELEQKYNEYLVKSKTLNERERIFNRRVEDKMVNRQVIETYENIDPEQAAVLMKNLYNEDPELAILIMRKIAGKKAGRILEALIPLDSEVSTQLAKQSLDYYKPE